MFRKRLALSKIKITVMLSLGLIILGISSIIWALIQINGQSVSISELENRPALSLPTIQLNNDMIKPIQTSNTTENIPEILYPIRPTEGDNIGNLIIPALDQMIPIFHGTHEDELKQGIGHFDSSVLPGEKDNSVLSGHRDTVFRELGQLEVKDLLIVETTAGVFTYKIREIKIVDSDDRTIITPTDDAVLTVTTCYPFTFIGHAPDRYILIADLIPNESN